VPLQFPEELFATMLFWKVAVPPLFEIPPPLLIADSAVVEGEGGTGTVGNGSAETRLPEILRVSCSIIPADGTVVNGHPTPVENAAASGGAYVEAVGGGVIVHEPVGTRSLAKKITLTNKGSVTVRVSGIAITGTDARDFAETNTCGKSVGSGASCFIKVTFKPLAKGKRTANVSVYDNGGGSPQQATLIGTGT